MCANSITMSSENVCYEINMLPIVLMVKPSSNFICLHIFFLLFLPISSFEWRKHSLIEAVEWSIRFAACFLKLSQLKQLRALMLVQQLSWACSSNVIEMPHHCNFIRPSPSLTVLLNKPRLYLKSMGAIKLAMLNFPCRSAFTKKLLLDEC